jgi:hypothetical protein
MDKTRKYIFRLAIALALGMHLASSFAATSGTITFVGRIAEPTYITQIASMTTSPGSTAMLDAGGPSSVKLSFVGMSHGGTAHASVPGLDQTQIAARYVDTDGYAVPAIPSRGFTIDHKGGTLSLTPKSNGSSTSDRHNLVVMVSYD